MPYPFTKKDNEYVRIWTGDTLKAALESGYFGAMGTSVTELALDFHNKVYRDTDCFDPNNPKKTPSFSLEKTIKDLYRADGTINFLNGSSCFWELKNRTEESFEDKVRVNIHDRFSDLLKELTKNIAVQNLLIALLREQGFQYAVDYLLAAKLQDIHPTLKFSASDKLIQNFTFTQTKNGGVIIKVETHIAKLALGDIGYEVINSESEAKPLISNTATYEIIPDGDGAKVNIVEMKETVHESYIKEKIAEKKAQIQNDLNQKKEELKDAEELVQPNRIKSTTRIIAQLNQHSKDCEILSKSIDYYIGWDNVSEKMQTKFKKLFSELKRSFNVFFNTKRFIRNLDEILKLKNEQQITDIQIKNLILEFFSSPIKLARLYKQIKLIKNEHQQHKRELTELSCLIEQILKEKEVSLPFVLLDNPMDEDEVNEEVKIKTKKIIDCINSIKSAKFVILGKVFTKTDIHAELVNLAQFLQGGDKVQNEQNRQIIKNYLVIDFSKVRLIDLLKRIQKIILCNSTEKDLLQPLKLLVVNLLLERGVSEKYISKFASDYNIPDSSQVVLINKEQPEMITPENDSSYSEDPTSPRMESGG